MREASYQAVKKMYINKHNYKLNNWYRPPNIDYKTFYSDIEVLKFSINKPESFLKVLLIGGEAGLAKVYKEYKYFGWYLDTPHIDSAIGLDISWDNFIVSAYGKLALIEGGASVYIPIPFTKRKLEIGGAVDMFSIGGGVGIYDNKFKIGAHLGYGYDLFLGIK